MKNKIDSIDVYGDMIAFSWLSTDTTYIKLKLLRVLSKFKRTIKR